MKTFLGGVHPPSLKFTANKAIENMSIPKNVIIPLAQHTGKEAELVVQIKSKVKAGTMIGKISGKISANVHSSVSGIIKSIEHIITPTGIRSLGVIIESDGKDEKEFLTPLDIEKITKEEIIERVKEAGIVGLGGAAFPTYFKLSPPPDKPVEIVILNGCECEPYLTGDHRLMLEKTEEILLGGKLIIRALNAKKGYIGIELNKGDAIEKIRKISKEYGFEVCVLKTKYPQGGEKQLIKAITGREVPSGGLPFDVGCYVQNVGTSIAIYEACAFGKPLIERVITVTGAVNAPKNLMVRIGTPIKDIIDFCGGYNGDVKKIIMGGPMMGIALPSDEMPIIKGTSGIIVQTETYISKDNSCIRCGNCIDACPMGLFPSLMADYISIGRFESAKELGLLDCIECGSCAWNCPSSRNLVGLFKYGKLKLR